MKNYDLDKIEPILKECNVIFKNFFKLLEKDAPKFIIKIVRLGTEIDNMLNEIGVDDDKKR